MNSIDAIMDYWKPKYTNAKAGAARWDGNAEKFAERELPTPENSMGMRIIQREEMAGEGSSVLDVGCGGGRFSFALERLGARVTATDFSPKMIELAQKKAAEKGAGVSFSRDDWHSLSIEEKGWEKRFDLVLAHMTPAVASGDTFMKLIRASRGWVLFVKPTRRKNSVLDELNRIAGAESDTKVIDETLRFAFDLAWLYGAKPRLEYEEQTWNHEFTLEEAVEEYTLRIRSSHELTAEGERAIREYLESIAREGKVYETSEMTIAAMYFMV